MIFVSRIGVRRAIKTQGFYWFVIVLVFLNTACVAVEHKGQDLWLTNFLCKNISKYIFDIISETSVSVFFFEYFWLWFVIPITIQYNILRPKYYSVLKFLYRFLIYCQMFWLFTKEDYNKTNDVFIVCLSVPQRTYQS